MFSHTLSLGKIANKCTLQTVTLKGQSLSRRIREKKSCILFGSCFGSKKKYIWKYVIMSHIISREGQSQEQLWLQKCPTCLRLQRRMLLYSTETMSLILPVSHLDVWWIKNSGWHLSRFYQHVYSNFVKNMKSQVCQIPGFGFIVIKWNGPLTLCDFYQEVFYWFWKVLCCLRSVKMNMPSGTHLSDLLG